MNMKLRFFPIFILILAAVALGDRLPRNPQRVNDLANVLSSSQERELTSYLQRIEETNGAQVVVLTVNTTGGESIESYSLSVAEKWKIGQKGEDNGVLLVVAKRDRNLRIEVGYGLEGELTDAKCSYIIRNTIVPYFKQNDYGRGIVEGVHTIGKVVLGEMTITQEEMNRSRSSSSGDGGGFIFGFIVLLIILRIVASVSPRATGFILLDILFSILRSSGGGGRGGGGFGGGGAFSGGGGSFGGGGSSGSW